MAATSPLTPPVLDLRTATEHSLAWGDVAAFRLELAEGDYLRLAVTEKELDVALHVFDPVGEALPMVDTPSRGDTVERISLAAPAAGSYHLEVRAAEGAYPPGRFLVTVEDGPRPATAEDLLRITAERLFHTGEGWRRRGRESFPQAVESYTGALEAWLAAPEPAAQAEARFQRAQLLEELGDLEGALQDYQAAIDVFHRIDHDTREAEGLQRLGGVQEKLQDLAGSLRSYGEAHVLFRYLGDTVAEAYCANALGNVYALVGRPESGLDFLQQARDLYRGLDQRQAAASAANNLAQALLDLGQAEQALDVLQEAVELVRGTDREAAQLGTLGRVRLNLGQYEAAVEVLEQACESARRHGQNPGSSLITLASAYRRLQQLGPARQRAQEALAVFEVKASQEGQALALASLAWLDDLGGQSAEALARYQRALELLLDLQAQKGRSSERLTASIHHGRARALRQSRALEEALASIEAAIATIESLRLNAVSQDLRTSFLAEAIDYYDLRMDLLLDLDGQQPFAGFAERAFEASEARRARGLQEALALAEAQERGLRIADPERLALEEDLHLQLSRADEEERRLLAEGAEEAALAQVAARQRDLLRRLQDLWARSGAPASRPEEFSPPEGLKLADLGRWLDEETILLAYAVGETDAYLWRISRDGAKVYPLGAHRPLVGWSQRFREALTHRSAGAKDLGRRLSQRLLGPVAASLGTARLVIVADGEFQTLPFAALPLPDDDLAEDETRPLISRHEVVLLPAAAVLPALRQRQRRPEPRKTLALFADPLFGRGDERLQTTADPEAALPAPLTRAVRDLGLSLERLPQTGREARAILERLPAAETYAALGGEARRQTVLEGGLRGYRFIHFATHGLVHSERPELSGLVLSLLDDHGRSVDGFLRFYEIYQLDLDADLVVLSACRTGLGRQIHGEGVVSLSHAFLHAGAASVLVSLWDVDDTATAALMTRFYDELLTKSLKPAAALRAAQLSFLDHDRWSDPYYWAAFTLHGDWK